MNDTCVIARSYSGRADLWAADPQYGYNVVYCETSGGDCSTFPLSFRVDGASPHGCQGSAAVVGALGRKWRYP